MRNCGPRALVALTGRPLCEIEARIRADRERHGNTRRGMQRITRSYVAELLRVLQGYGFALSSEWPKSNGYLSSWHRRHRSGMWFIRTGNHFLAKRGRYWWNVLARPQRVTAAVRLRKLKGTGQ